MTAPTRLEQLEAERDAYRAEADSLRAYRAGYEELKRKENAAWHEAGVHARAAILEAQAKAGELALKLRALEPQLVRLKLEVRALRKEPTPPKPDELTVDDVLVVLRPCVEAWAVTLPSDAHVAAWGPKDQRDGFALFVDDLAPVAEGTLREVLTEAKRRGLLG